MKEIDPPLEENMIITTQFVLANAGIDVFKQPKIYGQQFKIMMQVDCYNQPVTDLQLEVITHSITKGLKEVLDNMISQKKA